MTNEILLVIVLVLFLILFVWVEPIISKKKINNQNEYGSANFATKTQIKNTFEKSNMNKIKKTGFPIYFNKNLNKVWFDRLTPHYVYIGSTGSGKSVTSVIPMCTFIANAKEKRSVFITDPKGEIFNATSKMFKDKDYDVITIDFRNPELSNRLNLLEPIIHEYDNYILYEKKSLTGINQISNQNQAINSLAEANRLIKSISTMVFSEKYDPKDPFWNNASKSLLEGLIGFYLEEYKLGKIKKEQITLTSIRKFQNSFMEEKNFKKFTKYIEKKEYGLKSKDSLTSILTANENTFKSVTAVFGEKLSLFDDLNVANIISSSDFDFDILGRKKTALYIIVPDEDKVYFNLVTMIVGVMYKELVKLANNSNDKSLPIGVDFILDEFANCPPLPDIQTIVSVARSRNMRFNFYIQSFSQLNEVYGKDIAQIILDNCGLVYLKTNTQDTAEIISKRLGKKTIEANSLSQSLNLNNFNGTSSTSLLGRDLLTPEEVMKLHYKTIIFPTKGNPIIRDTVLYNKFKIYIKGSINRTKSTLSDLASTFFTVDNIEINNNASYRNNDNDLFSDFKEKEKYDKDQLEPIVDILMDILKEKVNSIKYLPSKDYGLYLEVNLNNKLIEKEKMFLKSRINDKNYYLEILENKKICNIHIKNTF